MADVEFDEDHNKGTILYTRFERSKKEPTMVTWMIKNGMAKTETQANFILLVIAIICFAVAVFVVFFVSGGSHHNPLPYSAVHGT